MTTAEPADASCGPELATELDPCLGGNDPLMTSAEFDSLIAGVSTPESSDFPSHLPAWTLTGQTTPTFPLLMNSIVKAQATLDGTSSDPTNSILQWVDGVVARVSPGVAENPELNLAPANPYMMTLPAYLYLAREARPDGRNCAADSDCNNPHYRCNRTGRCEDPAGTCRVQDIIFVAPFLDPPPDSWSPTACLGGSGSGADYNVWTLWMRWGIGCGKYDPCLPGSMCRNICEFLSDRFCADWNTCLPNGFQYDSDPPEPVIQRFLGDYRDFFPTFHPTDTIGRRFSVVSHTIFVGAAPSDSMAALAPLDYATAAATVGDGVAVTPCAPDVESAQNPPAEFSALISCDYEASYQRLLRTIALHAQNARCTPSQVGLPESSQSLIE